MRTYKIIIEVNADAFYRWINIFKNAIEKEVDHPIDWWDWMEIE